MTDRNAPPRHATGAGTTKINFRRATRKVDYLRAVIAGPSNSGKTFTGLMWLRALVGNEGRIAVLDTEVRPTAGHIAGSSELYAGEPRIGTFDVCPVSPPYDPRSAYIPILHAAAEAGYDGILVDSVSHAWGGDGGVLDIVDRIQKTTRGDKREAWKRGGEMQKALLAALTHYPGHVIVTMRTKSEWVDDEDPRTGKRRMTRVGTKPEQRDGFEYEFDLVLDALPDKTFTVSKTSPSTGARGLRPGPR